MRDPDQYIIGKLDTTLYSKYKELFCLRSYLKYNFPFTYPPKDGGQYDIDDIIISKDTILNYPEELFNVFIEDGILEWNWIKREETIHKILYEF